MTSSTGSGYMQLLVIKHCWGGWERILGWTETGRRSLLSSRKISLRINNKPWPLPLWYTFLSKIFLSESLTGWSRQPASLLLSLWWKRKVKVMFIQQPRLVNRFVSLLTVIHFMSQVLMLWLIGVLAYCSAYHPMVPILSLALCFSDPSSGSTAICWRSRKWVQ